MRRLLIGVLVLAFSDRAFASRPVRHVRVVLDLSQSMRTNDPGRLAILSTILLHDLADPNQGKGDSFTVVPFDLDWQWANATALPPQSTRPPITTQFGRREEFIRALQSLGYDARMTYFYPGLAAALSDLEQQRAAQSDVRTIVLVTDGVPESPTRDAELRLIREQLAPRLERSGIRLYVLAFGSEADRNRDFFDAMVHSASGTSLGEFFVDPRGSALLSDMAQIFARSFGYSPDAPRPVAGTASLDLEGQIKPDRVAVALFSGDPSPPELRLSPPAGGTVNRADGRRSAATAGGSFSLLWVLAPDVGSYGLDSNAVSGQVAVLRPTRLSLEIVPAPPLKQTERALAETPFPLRVIVRPANGVRGDPGPVDLSFRTLGEQVVRDGIATNAWTGERHAPLSPAGTATADGRVYDIIVEFQADREKPSEMYVGYVEVEARRGEAIVGILAAGVPHRVEVHPRLSIAPVPLTAYASTMVLERRQRACTQFTFVQSAGHLPHPQKPAYAIRGLLAPVDPATPGRELHEATFTLDGQSLQFGSPVPAQAGAWYKGRTLTPVELFREHELCAQIGRPKAGDPARPVELRLIATLLEDPYDEHATIQPFQLKVLIAPPSFIERWRAAVASGMSLLGLIALLWYSRNRATLPPDLGYAVARENSSSALVSRPIEQRSVFACLFGLVGERAVIVPGEDHVLGRIRPTEAELFLFRPARGVQVESIGGTEAVPAERGLASLAIRRPYRLRTDKGSYLFQLEYQ
ncbi:MAG TPA: vWA domain-containing protein [Thermoanaerobaculia bacterium]|nr:vWA domain-containing protein [Thermoanaerobaculia bacterium]